MDIATLIGFLGALGVITGAIFVGGSVTTFINLPSLLIVVGGTLMVVLMKFTLGITMGSFKVAAKAFLHRGEDPNALIEEGIGLAEIARKQGLLGLEDKPVSSDFLKRGIQFCVDGHDREFVRRMLSKEINATIERHELGQAVFRAIQDVAPAMGMIGTLIGLVQMLSNMSDPKAIGPAMAVALLTTLYGALIANAFAMPIADKLAHRSREERRNKQLILETVTAIQEGMSPRVMEEYLRAYLPPSQRERAEAQKEAA